MQKREYIGDIKHLTAEEYYKKISDISSACKKVEVFEFEGRYFSGSITGTIKAYLNENPDESFFVWLIDNGLEVSTKQ